MTQYNTEEREKALCEECVKSLVPIGYGLKCIKCIERSEENDTQESYLLYEIQSVMGTVSVIFKIHKVIKDHIENASLNNVMYKATLINEHCIQVEIFDYKPIGCLTLNEI